jgi:light-regulated signal transduction histidine kinase (bacteriophytochrome)
MNYADEILVLFKRLHRSEAYGGTGIGLAVWKAVIEQYGGKIWVESEPGKGSTFFSRNLSLLATKGCIEPPNGDRSAFQRRAHM